MLEEQRLGDGRAKTARSQQPSDYHDQVDEKDGQVTQDPKILPTTSGLKCLGF